MPYITKERRKILDAEIEPILDHIFHHSLEVGELNYVITRIIDRYSKPLCYQRINDVRGVLKCVGDEYYRRIAVPYEEKKKKENGDVYGE